MSHSLVTEWPIWHGGQGQQHAGGCAPLRHDIALERYLEKQASNRTSATRPSYPWASAIRTCIATARHAHADLRSWLPFRANPRLRALP